MPGIIALDIDGTLTHGVEEVNPEVVTYLTQLVQEGWQVSFITGRTFALAEKALRVLPFPYYLATYNGALIMHMPSRKVLNRHYLLKNALPQFESISREVSNDCVIYLGWENADDCYYRPIHFPETLQAYARQRQLRKYERWHHLTAFDELVHPDFASVKYFGCSPEIEHISHLIEEKTGFHAPLCFDSHQKGFGIVQVTHPLATKGEALRKLAALTEAKVTIAAGDGGNDASMFAVADIRVVMQNAPTALLKRADVIAPPAEENGLLIGLPKAIAAAGH